MERNMDKTEIEVDRNGHEIVRLDDPNVVGLSVSLARYADDGSEEVVGGIVEEMVSMNVGNGNGNVVVLTVKYNGDEERDYVELGHFIEARIKAEAILNV